MYQVIWTIARVIVPCKSIEAITFYAEHDGSTCANDDETCRSAGGVIGGTLGRIWGCELR